MLETGDRAPDFTLPGVVDGEIESVTLSEYAAGDIAVLSFYPADFSPVCTEELCSLRDLELVDLNRDVSLLGISTDSAYSHRAFAERYGIQFPLVSDSVGDVAERYGVLHEDFEGHERMAKRSVFVVGCQGYVQYAWATDDPSRTPDFDELQAAVESIQDDFTAIERYRDAFDHYRYGSSELDAARSAFENEEWGLAREAFGEAAWYFGTAADGFDSASAFAESEPVVTAAERASDATAHFRNAANWFGESATYYGGGETTLGDESRTDAVEQHEAAERLEPIDHPDDIAEDLAN